MEPPLSAPPVAPVFKPPSKTSRSLVVVLAVVGAFLVASPYLLRAFVIEAFRLPSGSMAPTLLVGDQVFISKWKSPVRRGDVIVFKYPLDPTLDYVKRVVAIGGDTIQFDGDQLTVNGVPALRERSTAGCPHEPTLDPAVDLAEAGACELWRETLDGRSYEVIEVPGRPAPVGQAFTVSPGTVFVVGDNRDNSSDSRVWGPVPLDHVKGHVLFIWMSTAESGVRWDRVGKSVQ